MKSINNFCNEAAQIIFNTMKTPENFLSFLTEASDMMYSHDIEKGISKEEILQSDHWMINNFIREVFLRWYKANKGEALPAISVGLEMIYDIADEETFQIIYYRLVESFQHDLESGHPQGPAFSKITNEISMFYALHECYNAEAPIISNEN